MNAYTSDIVADFEYLIDHIDCTILNMNSSQFNLDDSTIKYIIYYNLILRKIDSYLEDVDYSLKRCKSLIKKIDESLLNELKDKGANVMSLDDISSLRRRLEAQHDGNGEVLASCLQSNDKIKALVSNYLIIKDPYYEILTQLKNEIRSIINAFSQIE